MSSMLFEVYRCVQLNWWSVVCGCVLHRGQRGEGWCVSSTLCRYDIRMGLLLVRSMFGGAPTPIISGIYFQLSALHT